MSALTELKNFTFTSKYAQYIPELKRRESWKEAVERVKHMMLNQYKENTEVHKDIEWAYELMLKKRVLGSQRALQFGGPAVFKHHARSYNCCGSYIDRLRFFQECMYLLLCGTGTGFSVQKHHINKLPKLLKKKEGTASHIIEDSIEGWSDAVGILVSSYFKQSELFTEYNGKEIDFKFHKIRPKGSSLSSSSGKAPGPEPLKKTLIKIKHVLDKCLEAQLFRPIDAYDIVMHSSDAVISGGVRRSATICLFSADDQDMLTAKTGDWYKENPQRGRSNNSVVLLKDSLKFEEFNNIIQHTKEFGEPGFYLTENLEQISNPSLRKDTKILTKNGIYNIQDLENTQFEVSNLYGEWVPAICRLSGKNKKLYKIRLEGNIIYYATAEHKWPVYYNNIIKKFETKDLKKGYRLPSTHRDSLNEGGDFDYNDGFLAGWNLADGWITSRKDNNKKQFGFIVSEEDAKYGIITKLDNKILELKKSFINRKHKWTARKNKNQITYECNLQTSALDNFFKNIQQTHKKNGLAKRIWTSSEQFKLGYIDGLFSADGSVRLDKNNTLQIIYTSSSINLVNDLRDLLGFYGIKTRKYKRTADGSKCIFPNGKKYNKLYTSYIIQVADTASKIKFARLFSLSNKRKDGLLDRFRKDDFYLPKNNSIKILEITETDMYEDVWDISVNDNTHCFQLSHCITGNCVEISFYCYDEQGRSGWQMCNLSTINCSKIKSKEDFLEAAKAAAIIGTLQAGFTKFAYLGEASENITKREALLGVSMTGIMDKHDICLNPEYQKEAANIIKQTNKIIAEKININQAARTTCIKPEGTTSCLLGTSSGIHPHHAKRYIRRVQANKAEHVYQYFKLFNAAATEQSVWSANNTDDVISFPIEVEDGAKLKNQISALELLEIVKNTQINWVHSGKNEALCSQPWIQNNVSNTITVKPEEWEIITKYIYENRQYFCGISLLPESGDKDYQQSPFTTVHNANEIIKQYGEGSLWCSGLIELCLQSFNNLWDACDAILKDNFKETLNINKTKKELKQAAKQIDCWDRCRKFAIKYFNNDLKQLCYCLKDVYLWKDYCDLIKNFQRIDYTFMIEEEDNTKFEELSACAGGKCDLIH